jgi:hypothetical protein
VWTRVVLFSGLDLGVESLGHTVTVRLASLAAVGRCCLSPQHCVGSSCSTPLPALVILSPSTVAPPGDGDGFVVPLANVSHPRGRRCRRERQEKPRHAFGTVFEMTPLSLC